MADCCGGKNAGKPISLKRYLAGLGVFLGYHGTVLMALHAASLPFPKIRRIRDFQRKVFVTELKEIVKLEDINLNGRLDGEEPEMCVVDSHDVPTVFVPPIVEEEIAQPAS